jgi:PAS domain S-box-containing protein
MVSRNITKYKNIEEELKISTRFLEDIARTVPDIITVFSLSTNKIIYANRHQLEQFGYTPEQMFNLNSEERLEKIIHPDDREAGRKFLLDRNLLQNGEIIEIEQRIKTVNDEWQWYCTRSKVFTRDNEGNAAQIISFSYNINKQKLAEEEIHSLYKELIIKNRELEALNYELNTFTNIVANDYKETFRNLYTLLEFTISRDANNLTDAGKANLRRIQAGLQKIKLLTEDIITYSSVHTSGENVNIDMNLVIKHVENELKREIFETGLTIQHTKLPFVSGQPQLISLLFRHLVTNAIKFSSHERKAVITISHSTIDGSDLHYDSAMKDIQYTVLSVSDNGIGFDPLYAKDIFKMFFKIHEKGKYKGSGIGLAVCNKIMEIHHGFINAESIPLEGTTINCYFPLQKIKAGST